MGRLDARVAIVTGAARGQGAADAARMAAEGARVVLTDVLTDEGEQAAANINAEHPESAAFLPHDVTSEERWREVVGETVERFGGVHVLVNNAGVASFGPIATMSEHEYRAVIDVNQVAVFLGMQAVVGPMSDTVKRTGLGGSIVNISSVEGMVGTPGIVAYVASKWAVRGMTKTAALEFGPLGIRVNSVHPGLVDTEMIRPAVEAGLVEGWAASLPVPRMATADEIAGLVAYLASEESGYCTGAEFVIDGGMIVSGGGSPPGM